MFEQIICVGEGYIPKLGKALSMLGCRIIPVPANEAAAPALKYHADLSVFFADNHTAIIAPQLAGSSFSAALTDAGIKVIVSKRAQGSKYPSDVALCACRIGKQICCNNATIDNLLTRGYSADNVISVRQGYTKCAVCVVDDNSIITSDTGINKAVKESGIDSLLISQGNIELPGYDTGLIGGCSGRINNYIVFTGRLDRHPDKAAIESFIMSKGLEIICLTDDDVFDVGSILSNN